MLYPGEQKTSKYIEQMVLHVRKMMMIPGKTGVSVDRKEICICLKSITKMSIRVEPNKVVSISVTENGETTDYALADLKMEAKFGVNQEYDGIDELPAG